jgi:hypothetical protein
VSSAANSLGGVPAQVRIRDAPDGSGETTSASDGSGRGAAEGPQAESIENTKSDHVTRMPSGIGFPRSVHPVQGE